MSKVLPIYELTVNEESSISGVKTVGIVQSPAIKDVFMAFSEDAVAVKPLPEYKLCGPFMIPDRLIVRDEYQCFYTKDTIKKIADKFFKSGFQNSTSHEHAIPLYGNTVVESWIIEDPNLDKSKALGFNFPAGTWMITVKINDIKYWDEYIATGKVRGFSIEGFLSLKKEDNTTISQPVKNSSMIEYGKQYPLIGGGFIAVAQDWTVTGQDAVGNTLNVVKDGEYELTTGYAIMVKGGRVDEYYYLYFPEEYPCESEVLMKAKPTKTSTVAMTKSKKRFSIRDMADRLEQIFKRFGMSATPQVHADYALADGTVITVDSETLSAPVYDMGGQEIGVLKVTLNQVATTPAPVAPAKIPEAVTNSEVAQLMSAIKGLTDSQTKLQAEVTALRGGRTSPATTVKPDVETKFSAGRTEPVSGENFLQNHRARKAPVKV